ncbi:unnamed protein product, partial [Discosporangium mesarthrocarpum]
MTSGGQGQGEGALGSSVAGKGVSEGALGAVVVVARACAQSLSEKREGEALQASLLQALLPNKGPGGFRARDSGPCGKGSETMVPVLAAVLGSIRLGSRALERGGAAAEAIPSLLGAALQEKERGLKKGKGVG